MSQTAAWLGWVVAAILAAVLAWLTREGGELRRLAREGSGGWGEAVEMLREAEADRQVIRRLARSEARLRAATVARERRLVEALADADAALRFHPHGDTRLELSRRRAADALAGNAAAATQPSPDDAVSSAEVR